MRKTRLAEASLPFWEEVVELVKNLLNEEGQGDWDFMLQSLMV